MNAVERFRNKRQMRGKPSYFFLLMLLACVVLVAGFLFINSSMFLIHSVVVEGNKYVDAADVCQIAGIPPNQNIFRLNVSEAKSRLAEDLRIEDAEIERRFPATVAIVVRERRPLAYVATNYGFVQLDRQCVVLSAFKNIKSVSVPIITGVRLGNVYVGDKPELPPLNAVLTYLAALDEETLNQLSEVAVRPSGQFVAYTLNSTQIRLGEGVRLEEKAKLTGDILRDTAQKKLLVEYIDLTYGSPYIKFRR